VNQVLSREEVAALLQGVAESKFDPRESGPAKKRRWPDSPDKTKVKRKVQRWYLVNSPR